MFNKLKKNILVWTVSMIVLCMLGGITGVLCEELIPFDSMEDLIAYENQKMIENGMHVRGVDVPWDYEDGDTVDPNWKNNQGSGNSGTTGNTSSSASPSSAAPVKTEPPKCEHQYEVKITKEPTCAEAGELTYTCSKCGDTYTEEAPATGNHNYSAEITTEADCTHTGVETYTCSVCGDSYTKTIPMEEHKYTSEITKPASCTEDGILTYTCETCGDSYTEDIPALGHHTGTGTIAEEASTFFPGVMEYHCETCGELLKTEVIESKYPTYYLYIIIGICCVIGLGIIIVMIIMNMNFASFYTIKSGLHFTLCQGLARTASPLRLLAP